MNTSKLMIRGLAIVAGIAFLAGNYSAEAQTAVEAPEDQGAFANETVTFAVEPKVAGLGYQWLRIWQDGYVELEGETNKNLSLKNVGLEDVGLYACKITHGDRTEFTTAASLTVVIAAESISSDGTLTATMRSQVLYVYAQPLVGNGTKGTCPGAYAGYVTYTLPVSQGWGWAPSTDTTIHTASDITRTDTKVEYGGKYGDSGCAQTSVTVPHEPISPKYRFAIYFPNSVPSTNYPILLDGFTD